MKWLKSIFAFIAIVSATAITGSAFADHRHWHQTYYVSPADVRLTFSTDGSWYAPTVRSYYEPSPYDYGPARRYHYYGQNAGYYYYYGEPVFDYSKYNRQFPQSAD